MESSEKNEIMLVLKEGRVPAHKDKLAKHSLYFTSLFSENFSDHKQYEYPINYTVSLDTLKDFVTWTEETKEIVTKVQTHLKVEKCMEKFTKDHQSNVLELLEFSVVFMCDKLTNDLTSIIILHWMYGERIIEIWQVAERLGLEKLADVAFAACLDRFEDLPTSSLLELDLEQYMRLAGNSNVTCSRDWLTDSAAEAVRHYSSSAEHDSFSHLHKSLAQLVRLPLYPCLRCSKNCPNYVSCLVVPKSLENEGKIPSVYWWKNSKLSELVDLKDIANVMDHGKEVVGRQIIGRGFSIYVIGGERGLGTGRFPKTIWRYCLLTQTWFSFAELPRPRRHMAVGFIKNKLYLVGGVGQHRRKLSSVDILDIYSGTWSEGAKIPEKFTETPPCCIFDNELIYFKTHFHVYDALLDSWMTLKVSSPEGTPLIHVNSLMVYEYSDCSNDKGVYVGISDLDEHMIRLCSFIPISTSTRLKFISDQFCSFPRQVFNGSTLLSFSCSNGAVKIERGILQDSSTYQFVGISSTALKNVYELGFQSQLGCFNLFDPDNLHQQASATDQECLNF